MDDSLLACIIISVWFGLLAIVLWLAGPVDAPVKGEWVHSPAVTEDEPPESRVPNGSVTTLYGKY